MPNITKMAEEDLQNMSPEQFAELQKQNCIFCKIAGGEIPSKKIYEDDFFIGILDINPAAEGHILVIPIRHYQILPQMDSATVGNLGAAIQDISSKTLKAIGCEGTSIFIANGAVAGQKAPHFMAHIIPRKGGDNLPLNPRENEIPENEYSRLVSSLIARKAPAKPDPSSSAHLSQRNRAGTSIQSKDKKHVRKKTALKPKSPDAAKPDLDKISRMFT